MMLLLLLIVTTIAETTMFCQNASVLGDVTLCHKLNPIVLYCGNGGSLQCKCSQGCAYAMNNNREYMCINGTKTKPKMTIKYPCDHLDPHNPVCNYYGNSTTCTHQCSYDKNYKFCKFDQNKIPYVPNNLGICEPFIFLECPHGLFTYDIVKTNPRCDFYVGICFSFNMIGYPVRLRNQYDGIMCKASAYGGCNDKYVVETCCV